MVEAFAFFTDIYCECSKFCHKVPDVIQYPSRKLWNFECLDRETDTKGVL